MSRKLSLTYLLLLFTVFLPSYFMGQIETALENIPAEVFVNNGKTDFGSLLFKKDDIKEKVKIMHGNLELDHDLSILETDFETYWKYYEKQWHYIQFKESERPFLIFLGLISFNDPRQYVQIYDTSRDIDEKVLFAEIGKLLAYKINPFTQEIVLYVHTYPCCGSASHNIHKIRQQYDNLKVTDQFFVGRDNGDMVGPFFPETASFDNKYYQLSDTTELRWSPAIVEKNAFLNWTESNLMIRYKPGALYRKLYDNGEWLFVIMLNGIMEEQSMMLHYTNFTNKGVYGWIRKPRE